MARASTGEWYVAWKDRREVYDSHEEAQEVFREDVTARAMGPYYPDDDRIRAEQTDDDRL